MSSQPITEKEMHVVRMCWQANHEPSHLGYEIIIVMKLYSVMVAIGKSQAVKTNLVKILITRMQLTNN